MHKFNKSVPIGGFPSMTAFALHHHFRPMTVFDCYRDGMSADEIEEYMQRRDIVVRGYRYTSLCNFAQRQRLSRRDVLARFRAGTLETVAKDVRSRVHDVIMRRLRAKVIALHMKPFDSMAFTSPADDCPDMNATIESDVHRAFHTFHAMGYTVHEVALLLDENYQTLSYIWRGAGIPVVRSVWFACTFTRIVERLQPLYGFKIETREELSGVMCQLFREKTVEEINHLTGIDMRTLVRKKKQLLSNPISL
jgi:hypothetical protein